MAFDVFHVTDFQYEEIRKIARIEVEQRIADDDFPLSSRNDAMVYRVYADSGRLTHEDIPLPTSHVFITPSTMPALAVGDETDCVQPNWTSDLIPFLNSDSDRAVYFTDTHKSKYLGGRAPDTSVLCKDTLTTTADNVVAIIELKGSLSSPDEIESARGQTVSYLESILRIQPDRQFVYGAVTDNVSFTLMRLTRKKRLYIVRETQFGIEHGAEQILNWMLHSSEDILGYRAVVPPGVGFKTAGVLGWGAFAVAYSGKWNQKDVVFKNYGTHMEEYEREVHALKLLNRNSVKHVPTLEDHIPDYNCTLATPVGVPFSQRRLPTLRQALQLIDTVEAAHKAGLVHKDIKCSNIFSDSGDVLLNDWSNSEENQDADRMKQDIRLAVRTIAKLWDPHNTSHIGKSPPTEYAAARLALEHMCPDPL